MMGIIGLLGAFASFESYRFYGFQNLTYFYMQWTGLFFLVLAVFRISREETFYLETVKNYMVEYLENVCVRRYEKANQEVRHEEVREPEETVSPVEEPEPRRKTDQEIRIRAILEEFMA